MNALTWGDYFGIAIFTIGLFYLTQFVWLIFRAIFYSIKSEPIDTLERSSVHDLLESGDEVTMKEIRRALDLDKEQGLIKSYVIGSGYITYEQYGGRKCLIELSHYSNVV